MTPKRPPESLWQRLFNRRFLLAFCSATLCATLLSPALVAQAPAHIHLTIDPRSLSTVDAQGNRAIEPGSYTLHLGGSQPTNSSTSPDTTLATTFTIHGTKELPK
jgi:hypothetical protein